MPFCEETFGDSVLWVDVDQPAKEVAVQIATHVEWVRNNPEQAHDMAKRANAIFVERFNLQDQLQHLPGFLAQAVSIMADPMSAGPMPKVRMEQISKPRVDVIMRIGSREVNVVERAVRSVAKQSYPNIGLILVKFRSIDGLQNLINEFEPSFSSVHVVEVPDDGTRSTALWAGLNATSGKYLCNLDDDDIIHSGHIAALVAKLEEEPENVPLAYTGTIEVQEEDGFWFDQPNFSGDIAEQIKERRRLRFMDEFSVERMKRFDNFVNSNAWMAKRSALTSDILEDPRVTVAEDVYLYLMLLRQGPFAFVPVATAEWHWRSKSRDNSMFAVDLFEKSGQKVSYLLRKHGALDDLPQFVNLDLDLLSKIRRVVRKPSLLLGSYAPRWRRFRQRIRNMIAHKRRF
jgi:phosphoglycerol transferase